jgi:hypothetical protein
MRMDDRSWLLFLYLVYHVPCHALARILIEGDFIPNLDVCLHDGERALELIPAKSDGPKSNVSTPELKITKRKRDRSDRAMVRVEDQGPRPNTFPALLGASICAAIKRCVELSTANVDQTSAEHIKLALAASPGIAASVTGRLTSSFVAIVSHDPPSPLDRSVMLEYVTGLFGLWEYRTEEDASTSNGESDREFTAQSLSSWLAFLKWLKMSDLAPGNGHNVRKIERLIALHSVLPARTEFLSTHSLSNPSAASLAKDAPILDLISRIPSGLSPLLYDIAVRSMPRTTVRRRQCEQPWLEALFSKLATSFGDDDLQDLVQVALARKVAIPQTELSKIALRQFSKAKIQWPLLINILQMDACMFLSTPLPLMERLCDSIANSGKEEYALIRDSVLIPLMRAAAQNRELLNFVHVWHRMLLEDIQENDSSTQSQGNRVWQDPDVFTAFTNITRTNATPAFVHHLLGKLLEHSRGLDLGGDAGSSALAWTAIVGCVIISRAKDWVTEAGVLRQLLEAAATAITRSQYPEFQHWRLWRLMRQILTILPDEKEPDGILTSNASGLLAYKSLRNWQDFDNTSEMIECFHLLVCRAVALPDGHKELLQQEFNCLPSILQGLCENSRPASELGSADACLGIILQNTKVLLLTRTEKLWPGLWRYATTSGSTTRQRIFEGLISADTVTSSQALLSQCFKAIHDSILGDEGHRSHFAYQILLSMPCQNIKRSQERAKLVKLLEDAGVIEHGHGMRLVHTSESNSGNPLFREFKSRATSSSTIPHAGGCQPFLEADSFERLCLELDHAKLTLESPNQYVVDDLLSALTLLTSPDAPEFETMPTNGPSAIYQRLCSLTSVLLTRFRKRLGGRYHLLLPVLQGLLRCLFRPIPTPASSKQPQIHHHQPPWLTNSDTEPLTAKSATQYTRLLTSLCDPTASSVKHSRSPSAGLTDDTKKAKSIAGQYMQYLVMEYARCQLQGQLLPEVKAALMPGLYTVLDVMSRDLMRGMNAAMDSSSRAIFKGLYEDYQRFGRWNHN